MSQAAVILWLNSELKAMSDLPRNVHNCTAMLDLPGQLGKDSFIKWLFMLQLCNVTTAFIGNQIKTPNDPEQSASVAVILSGAGLVSQTSCLLKISVLQLNYFLSSWVFSWKMHFSWSWQEGKKEEVPSDAKPTDVPLKSVCIKNLRIQTLLSSWERWLLPALLALSLPAENSVWQQVFFSAAIPDWRSPNC